MKKVDRKLLLKNRLSLVEDIEANDITSHLYQDGVITENDREKVEVQKTRRDRIEFLLDLLPRKGPKAFDQFCHVLDQSESYQHLARKLAKCTLPEKGNGVDSVDSQPIDHSFIKTGIGTSKSKHRDTSQFYHDYYPMNSTPRGYCFIINNMHFFKHSDRKGSEKDATNLQSFFYHFGFLVWLINDVDSHDIRKKFTELAAKTNHGDCLVVCLLSHGISGHIFGIDGELVSISELLDILNEGPCASVLAGKPKWFLIQACRDYKVEDGKDLSISSSQVISESSLQSSPSNVNNAGESSFHSFIEENHLEKFTDLVLAYSTFPGEVSWRHPSNGSYFIDAVLNVLRKHALDEDVLSMLVKVNHQVSTNLAQHGKEQIPAPVFTLTKKFYLCPP